MDKSLKTAMQFIQALTFADVTELNRAAPSPESLKLFLPKHQLLLPEAPEPLSELFPYDSVTYVTDRLLVSYCFLGLADSILVIGPYRSRALRRFEASKQLDLLHVGDALLAPYLSYYSALPQLSDETVNTIVHNLLIAIYDEAHGISEHLIDMSAQHTVLSDVPPLSKPFSAESIQSRHSLEEFYMAQVAKGDFSTAYPAFQKLSRESTPVGATMDNEGFSIVCTMTRIAARSGGAPAIGLHTINEAYRARIKHSRQAEEIQNLVYHYIKDICAIVRRYQTIPYGQPIRHAIEYISRNLSDPLSLATIAEEVGRSPSWLSRTFHQETGQTLTDYITRERMRAAADHLAYSSLSVQEISTLVGILDHNYFTKLFKRIYGITPTEFRRKPQSSHLAPD